MSNESPASILFDENGNPVGVIQDGYFYRLMVQAQIAPGSVIGIDSGNTGGLALDTTVADTTHNVVSVNNSTTVPLAADTTFVGTADDMTIYQEVDINIAGEPSVAPATLYFEFSPDGSNWDVSVPLVLTGPSAVPLPLRTVLPFFRVRYVNGSIPLTQFRLTVLLHRQSAKHLTRFLNQEITVAEPVENVRAFVGGLRPDGTFGNVPVSQNNFLGISVDDVGALAEDRLFAADKSIFGQGVVSPRMSQLITDFSTSDIFNNDIGMNLVGSGSVFQSNGLLTIESGIDTTASAQIFTNKTIQYSPGREIYTQFTAAFTLPTDINSEQRSGIYDGYNGFFLGYNGTSFGITVRNLGTDTFTPLISCNGDPLDGDPNSRFTRGAVPEPINFSLENVYRIRFGWLGAAPIVFQVMAPDGQWVTFNTIRQPNTSSAPSIANPNLPITFEVIKTGSDGYNLQLFSSSWDAGTVEDPSVFGIEDLRSHQYVTAQLSNEMTTQIVRTNSPGRLFKCTSIVLFVVNTSTSNPGQLNIIDGYGSDDILIPISLTTSNNQFGSQASMNLNFPTPLRFSTDTTVNVVSGILTYSITIIGYETS